MMVVASLENWVGGLLAIIGTVLLQLGVQLILIRRFLARRQAAARPHWRSQYRSLSPLTLMTVLTLVLGHLAQVGLWTGLYLALGEFTNFGDASYFSLASYTPVGANDLELSRGHRVLGAIEAGVGVLMFGWSGAILVALVGLTAQEESHDPP